LPLLKGTEKNNELFREAFLGINIKPAPPPHAYKRETPTSRWWFSLLLCRQQ